MLLVIDLGPNFLTKQFLLLKAFFCSLFFIVVLPDKWPRNMMSGNKNQAVTKNRNCL